MIDRFVLLAITPLTLAGGAVGWTWSDFTESLPVIEGPGPGQKQALGNLALASPVQTKIGIPAARRSPDGLFRTVVKLNGHAVPMVIDTGATRSVLSSSIAKRMDLTTIKQPGRYLATIAGTAAYRTAPVKNVRVGSVSLGRVDMIVASGPNTISLLGQDILREIGPIRISADQISFE